MKEVKVFPKNQEGEQLVGLKTYPDIEKDRYPTVLLLSTFKVIIGLSVIPPFLSLAVNTICSVPAQLYSGLKVTRLPSMSTCTWLGKANLH